MFGIMQLPISSNEVTLPDSMLRRVKLGELIVDVGQCALKNLTVTLISRRLKKVRRAISREPQPFSLDAPLELDRLNDWLC